MKHFVTGAHSNALAAILCFAMNLLLNQPPPGALRGGSFSMWPLKQYFQKATTWVTCLFPDVMSAVNHFVLFGASGASRWLFTRSANLYFLLHIEKYCQPPLLVESNFKCRSLQEKKKKHDVAFSFQILNHLKNQFKVKKKQLTLVRS